MCISFWFAYCFEYITEICANVVFQIYRERYDDSIRNAKQQPRRASTIECKCKQELASETWWRKQRKRAREWGKIIGKKGYAEINKIWRHIVEWQTSHVRELIQFDEFSVCVYFFASLNSFVRGACSEDSIGNIAANTYPCMLLVWKVKKYLCTHTHNKQNNRKII